MAGNHNSGKKRRYTAAQVIEALTVTRGMAYLAADRLGCGITTIYNYINTYPTVKEAHEHANGRALDMSETMLMQSILNGDVSAIKYHLSTKGKHRGYTTAVELDVTHRMDTEIAQAREALGDVLALTGDRLRNADLNGHSQPH